MIYSVNLLYAPFLLYTAVRTFIRRDIYSVQIVGEQTAHIAAVR